MAGQTKFLKFVTICSNFRSVFVNRQLTNYTQVATIRQLSREKLDSLPEKPKKPLTPFLIFSQRRRDELRKIHPVAKMTDIVKLMANEWKVVDSAVKQRYEIEYKNAMTEYLKQHLAYNAKLTENQRSIIKEVANEKAKERQNRKSRKTLKELKKPKRPKGPYIFFVLDYYGRDKTKFNSFTAFLKQSKSIWENLPQPEKQKFHDMYLDDKKRYELEMELWEAKMVSEGHINLVRRDTLAANIKPTRKITKPSTNLHKEQEVKTTTKPKHPPYSSE